MFSGLGVSLFLAGLVVIALAWTVLRILSHSQTVIQSDTNSFVFPKATKSNEAIIMLQPGGRVEHISDSARAYFDLRENEPYDLESLARRVRPPDDFLDLSVVAGTKRVTIGGRLVEVASYEVPGPYPMMLISLRGRDYFPSLEDGNGASGEILRMATVFSQSMATSLDLEATIRSIMDNVSRLIPSDVLELKLWNAEQQSMMMYRFEQFNSASLVTAPLSQFGSLTHQLIASRIPILIADTRSQAELNRNGELLPIQSYLGIPLMAGGELVGALEAGQTTGGAFSQHDLDLLALVAGQMAGAIRNAKLYEDEQKRVAELVGLANLNQALGSMQDVQEVFANLVDSIAPLFSAEIVGFLLYDEENHTLAGQIPFRGLPAHFVQIYRTVVPRDGLAEKIILGQQPILTLSPVDDEKWRALGLADAAMAASLRDQALVPLISSGRMLGYFQVGHHSHGVSAFSADEIRLMNIVANQAAAIIENVLLIQQAHARTQRADTLLRIASLSVSSATLEEILKYSVKELVDLFQADAGAIFLVDEAGAALRLHRESTVGISEDISNSFIQIFMDDPNFRHTVSESRKPFLSGRLSTDGRILPAYRPLVAAMMMESALVVPLVARDRSIGELMLGSRNAHYFNTNDLQVVNTAAGQLATAIESADLLTQTDASLRRRVDQLSAITRISRQLGASLDTRDLLQVVHDEGLRAVQADCMSIILFDNNADLDEPKIQLFYGCENGRDLTILERNTLKTGKPHIIADYSQEGISPPHEGLRSAIIAPIMYQTHSIGLINMHAGAPGFFAPEITEWVQTLAEQAGRAFSNAQRYQGEKQRIELMRRRADTLVHLTDVSYSLGLDQPLDQALQSIARGIRDSTPFRVVLISLVEPKTGMLRRLTALGLPQETLNELLAHKQPLLSVQQLMRPEFKISRSYYIPVDHAPVVLPDIHMVGLDVSRSGSKSTNDWDPNDFLLIPLENAKGQIVGLISLDDPSNGLRPDQATIELVEVFSAQAALLIGNHLRQSELNTRIDSLSSVLQRQKKLHDINLPVLLHKDLEQTISMHNLDKRAQRVRAGLAITESVSRQLDASSALSALGRETLTQLGMSVALVAENTLEGSRLLHVMGSLPRSTNVEALFGQRNPLRTCLQTGAAIMISNLDEDDEWRDASLLTSLHAKGVICLPILVENKPVAAMLAVSPEPIPSFTDEDRQVYMQISQQTSLILQNISLLNQTRRRLDEVNLLLDFSRQLSGMDTDAIIKSLLDNSRRVLQHAHAGVVLIWNPKNETLVPRAVSGYADNKSMMKIKYRRGEAMPGNAFANKQVRRVDELDFAREYNLSAENLALYRQATGGRLPVSCLLIPIITSDQCLGLLLLDNFNATSAFKAEDEALLLSLAQQVALSVDNLRLVQTTQERAGQLQALNDASASLFSASLDPQEVYASVYKAAERLMPLDSFVITLLDEEKNEIETVYLLDRGKPYTAERVPFGKGMSSEVIKTSRPILISNIEQVNRMDTVQVGEEDEETQSIVAVPMMVGGKALGMLSAQNYQAGVYTEEDMQILGTLANQAIVAIQNGRLFAETQELTSNLEIRVVERTSQLQREQQNTETLLNILTEVSSNLNLERALNRTLSLLNKAIGAEQSTILMVQAEDNLLHYRAGYGYISDRSIPGRSGFTLKIGEGLAGWVLEHREAVLVDDLYQEPRWVRNPTSGQDHRSAIAVPMLVGDDVIGVLMVFHRAQNFFSAEMLNLVKAIGGQVAVAINNAHLYELIRDQADRLGAMLRKEQEDASRSQAILEAVADGVLVTGANNRITFVNSSSEKILNMDKSILLDNSLESLGATFGKAVSTWIQTIRRWSEDPSSYQPGDTHAEQLELENGRIALVHLAPVILQNDFLGTVSIFRDVTHEVEVDRLKSEFVATVSHELRTPMTAIKGYVDILTMGAAGALNENQAHFLDIVRKNMERLNTLVSDLLDISRIEAGRVTLNLQAVNLHALAEEVVADVSNRSHKEDKPMTLSLDAPKDLPPIQADADRVRQILGNLVNNAFNYTPHNGTILVNIHREKDEVQVDVQDNGVGIAPEDQARIFERFFRGEHPLVLSTPGTGLGLPIVRQLVEMHKGRIWMTSAGVPGKGSIFSFTLPIGK